LSAADKGAWFPRDDTLSTPDAKVPTLDLADIPSFASIGFSGETISSFELLEGGRDAGDGVPNMDKRARLWSAVWVVRRSNEECMGREDVASGGASTVDRDGPRVGRLEAAAFGPNDPLGCGRFKI